MLGDTLPLHLPSYSPSSTRPPSSRSALSALKFFSRGRWRRIIFLAFVSFTFLFSILWVWHWNFWLRNFFSYSMRPLYDTAVLPRKVITHLHSPGIPQNDDAACKRHGWTLWKNANGRPPAKVVDAIIFSVELDLLEIRLAELSPLISHVLILESTTTFTGLPKPLVLGPLLQANSTDKRFHPYLDKIRYRSMQGRNLSKAEDPFNIEKEMRLEMGTWLSAPDGGVVDGDLVLMSDVDEIPSLSALTLLASCATPSPIHLALSQHLYTFQNSLSPLPPSWRARAVRYQDGITGYSHAMTGFAPDGSNAFMLSDAGWHCSFCFKYIGDFVFKARGFSHTDRLGMGKKLLAEESIKQAVCEGRDFFGMLPEAYDWNSLLARWNGAGRREVGSLPSEVVRNGREKWGWLLGLDEKPGRCSRSWERGDEWKFGDERP